MIILSIVIPIYKVEKYIKKCIDSILSQIKNRTDVEIILIDDGTPDESAVIASKLIYDHKYATIYHQTNQGLSCARNKGLDKARGEYVWFIDSDDSIEPSVIDGIIESLLNNQPDLLQLNYQMTFEDNKPPIPKCQENRGTISGKELLKNGSLPAPAQFTIYKRSFLLKNNLRFVQGLLHEDSEFKPRVTYLAKKITWHTPIVYNYLQRSNGNIMSSFSYKNAHDIVIVNNNLLKFANQRIKEKECLSRFYKIIGMNVNTILNGVKSMSASDKKNTIDLLKENKIIFRTMINSGKLKYIMEGLILNINVRTGLNLYQYLKLL